MVFWPRSAGLDFATFSYSSKKSNQKNDALGVRVGELFVVEVTPASSF